MIKNVGVYLMRIRTNFVSTCVFSKINKITLNPGHTKMEFPQGICSGIKGYIYIYSAYIIANKKYIYIY